MTSSSIRGSDEPNLDSNPEVIGELTLNGHRYLIVNRGSGLGAGFSSAVCFQLNGVTCTILDEAAIPQHEVDLMDILTERELQIAAFVAHGRPNKQIAHRLHISEWTVSAHLRRIFAKLGVRSRAAMVYRCAPLLQHQQDSGARGHCAVRSG